MQLTININNLLHLNVYIFDRSSLVPLKQSLYPWCRSQIQHQNKTLQNNNTTESKQKDMETTSGRASEHKGMVLRVGHTRLHQGEQVNSKARYWEWDMETTSGRASEHKGMLLRVGHEDHTRESTWTQRHDTESGTWRPHQEEQVNTKACYWEWDMKTTPGRASEHKGMILRVGHGDHTRENKFTKEICVFGQVNCLMHMVQGP